MLTFVYVDGFNLYYGALKDTRFKWLNIAELCSQVLQPKHRVDAIRYFTADVKPRQENPQTHVRQQVYLRALRTLPQITVHKGNFLSHVKSMPLATPTPGGPKKVDVIRTEEKGSDVNLATHLLCDAFEQKFECAVVISNDSDLVAPIREVRHRLKLPVGVICPHASPSVELGQVAAFRLKIEPRHLAKSQFDEELRDSVGAFRRPPDWAPRGPSSGNHAPTSKRSK